MKPNLLRLPDPEVTQLTMIFYGYTWKEMLPMSKKTAIQLWKKGYGQIYRLYNVDYEEAVNSYEEFDSMDPDDKLLYGIEKEDWVRCETRRIQKNEGLGF